VVVPVGATVKILTTAADVIHSFAMPAFYLKMDAVPGRINETWFKTDRPGVYFGQCSELCGTKHAYMPIAIEVLPKAQFDAWVAAKQKENGIEPKVAEAAAPAEAAPSAVPAADAVAPAADAAAAAPAAQ
jgi:cytochrome c oxidase subunit 2